jgi:arylsulfatase
MPITRRSLGIHAARAICALPFFGRVPEPGSPPNVLLIVADDQGYGDFSSHGNPELRTPELDRFRGESVRFTDFHSSPMCTPTRAQLMTGRDALYTRAMNVSSGRTLLRRDIPTVAEAFQVGGYGTGIFGKWHLGDNYPYRPQDRGFQETLWFPSSHIGSAPDAWNNDYFNDRYRHNGRLRQYEGYSTDVFFRAASEWMAARQKAGKRFFAYLPLNAPHGPLFAPPEFVAPYKHLPERIARYYGMIANIDFNLGRLEKLLRELKLRDNTIVMYLTDNGGATATARFNAGMRGNKTTLWEGGHRVPFFIRWPAGGLQGGRDISELAEMQDLFPTLLELCGVKWPAGALFDGVSLAPLLRGRAKALPDRTLVVQFSRMDAPRPRKNDAAVLWKRWRLIGGNELYDLATDPGQQTNLFGQRPEIVARLQTHYDRWWKNVEPSLDSFLPVHVGSDQENPTMLSVCEWADVFLDQSAQVRRGERKNGVWHVQVEKPGTYEIALRRWPRDVDAALGDGVPAHQAEDGVYPAGVAIPIAQARLKIGSFDQKAAVAPADREAVFRVALPAGPATIESWFLDAGGEALLGAYYAYVEHKATGTARLWPGRSRCAVS